MQSWTMAVAVVAIGLGIAAATASARDTAASPPPLDTKVLDAVIVSGAVPGPGLWRVSHAGHELYVLGTITPMATGMEWVASEVDDILSRSDEVIAPGGVEPHVGVGDAFKISLLARSAIAATKLPEKQKLVDVLPPLLFRDWTAMKARFLRDKPRVERSRPLFASTELYYAAIEASGMTGADIVWERVQALAEEKDIPVVETQLRFPLKLEYRKYKAGITALAESRVDDTHCFAQTLATLESDLETMRAGARAWATGDLETLQELRHADVQPACKQTYDEVLGFQRSEAAHAEADAAWLAAATSALRRNEVTFAVAPISKLVGARGALEQLRSAGFDVEAPESDSTGGG